ncbi:MAG: hypothetical protein GF346_05120 [Candidatus Eisenbacteria bacterium]|nr:hypothetical protein [Candidatus Latescibacterota bacterium]MBD3301807.1 hypothetical protein [Candidatus Eisenbacteria bacterium]
MRSCSGRSGSRTPSIRTAGSSGSPGGMAGRSTAAPEGLRRPRILPRLRSGAAGNPGGPMDGRFVAFSLILLCLFLPASLAQTDPPDSAPAPPGVTVRDAPNDNGTGLIVEWEPIPDDAAHGVTGYRVVRFGPDPGEETVLADLPRAATEFLDRGLKRGREYRYAVAGLSGEEEIGPRSEPAVGKPRPQWFHSAKGFLLMNLIVVSAAILISVFLAARGRVFTIRKIAGIEAVEEAVGRATEMGKSILFVPGIQDMDNVQTVAGMTILGSISQMVAHYETRIDVPVSKSLVMSTGREVVKEAYTTAGRPDLFNENIVHYVTDEQFGYVAAIDGLMLRDRPATCIYMGAFFAESLILSETGNSIGAIQIAGTAMPTQLPFFVAACDYTLIGEELFAASAYLSKSPSLLGSLRGQDIGKALAMLFILVGVTAETIGHLRGDGSIFQALSDFLRRFFATNF